MRRVGPLLILVVGLLALVVDFVPGLKIPSIGQTDEPARLVETKLGLDLQGGLRVEYQANCVEGKCPDAGQLGVIRDIMERRVNSTGVAEPVVTTQGSDRIVVELPGVSDPAAVRRLVGQTGRLEFVPITDACPQPIENQPLDLGACPPLFSGDQVANDVTGIQILQEWYPNMAQNKITMDAWHQKTIKQAVKLGVGYAKSEQDVKLILG